jgi:uncharacterized protein YciI
LAVQITTAGNRAGASVTIRFAIAGKAHRLLRWGHADCPRVRVKMPASGAERIKELTQRMLRKRLYVILSKGHATPEQIAAVLPQHLEYMIGLEKKGVLFASGPFTGAQGAPAGDGLTILRAESVEAARAIAAADPFVVNKLRNFEVREWTLMEGSFGVKLNFSDQSLDIA